MSASQQFGEATARRKRLGHIRHFDLVQTDNSEETANACSIATTPRPRFATLKSMSSDDLISIIIGLSMGITPGVIAGYRQHRHPYFVNILALAATGWMAIHLMALFGWMAALVWAAIGDVKTRSLRTRS